MQERVGVSCKAMQSSLIAFPQVTMILLHKRTRTSRIVQVPVYNIKKNGPPGKSFTVVAHAHRATTCG